MSFPAVSMQAQRLANYVTSTFDQAALRSDESWEAMRDAGHEARDIVAADAGLDTHPSSATWAAAVAIVRARVEEAAALVEVSRSSCLDGSAPALADHVVGA